MRIIDKQVREESNEIKCAQQAIKLFFRVWHKIKSKQSVRKKKHKHAQNYSKIRARLSLLLLECLACFSRND